MSNLKAKTSLTVYHWNNGRAMIILAHLLLLINTLCVANGQLFILSLVVTDACKWYKSLVAIKPMEVSASFSDVLFFIANLPLFYCLDLFITQDCSKVVSWL